MISSKSRRFALFYYARMPVSGRSADCSNRSSAIASTCEIMLYLLYAIVGDVTSNNNGDDTSAISDFQHDFPLAVEVAF